MELAKDACVRENMVGSGEHGNIETHSLRGTIASILFRPKHSDSTVGLEANHRQPGKTLMVYKNVPSEECRQHDKYIFNDGFSINDAQPQSKKGR